MKERKKKPSHIIILTAEIIFWVRGIRFPRWVYLMSFAPLVCSFILCTYYKERDASTTKVQYHAVNIKQEAQMKSFEGVPMAWGCCLPNGRENNSKKTRGRPLRCFLVLLASYHYHVYIVRILCRSVSR